MPQLAIAAAGAWVGGATLGTGVVALGMTGTAIGWTVGSLVGSLLFAPDGPKAQIGDTRAPKIDFGSRMPRVYGTVRVPMNARWLPDFTADEQSSGGKGGGGGSSFYTYTTSPLYWLADRENVQGISRLWMNGKLVYSVLASSDAETLAASVNSDHWDALEFFDGNGSQLPWSVYEAAVGSVNADAHRRIACAGITNLKCGNSPQLPFMEAEIYTNATAGDPLTLLQSRFIDANPDDESFYARGAPTITATGAEVTDGQLSISAPDGDLHYIEYAPAGLYANGTGAVTFEAIISNVNSPASSVGVTLTVGLFYSGHIYWPSNGPPVYVAYDEDGEVGNEAVTPGEVGYGENVHVALVLTAAGIRVYVGGSLIYAAPGDYRPPDDEAISVLFGNKLHSGTGPTSIGFRVRQEEVYTGSSFAPPGSIPSPDGPTVIPLPEDLADVVAAECELHGLTPDEYDVTALEGIDVSGFPWEGSARGAIDQLMAMYYFSCLPGRKLVFFRLDQASIVTIPAERTGAGQDEAREVFAGLMRGNDLELPAQLSLTGPNPSADYDPITATSDRIVTVGNRIDTAQIRVVFTPAELKGRANANVLDARVAAHTATLSLNDAYLAYEPGDVVTHTDHDGNSYVTRWTRESYANGVREIDLRLFDRSVLTLTGEMSDTYTPAITVRPAVIPSLVLIDSNIFRDADDDHGIYATVYGDGEWEGAELFMSRDGSTYESVGTFANRGIVGTAEALDPYSSTGTWDDEAISVSIVAPGTLTSSTKEAVEADASINVALVGEHGRWEAVRFATATLTAPQTYTLTGFLRGQFGTEHANADHEADDRFVLMRTTGIIRAPLVAGDIGATLYFKAVPPRRALADVSAETVVYTAEGLKPYAPVDLAYDGTDVTWNRRSRLAYPAPYTLHPPLGEASESYLVTVTRGAAVLHEETVAAPRWPVSAGAAGDVITVKQVSAVVGAGYGASIAVAEYPALPGGWSAARGHNLRPLFEHGGTIYAIAYEYVGGLPQTTIYTSADGGETFVVAYAATEPPFPLGVVTSSGDFLSTIINYYADSAGQSVGNVADFSSSVIAANRAGSVYSGPWYTHGYPRLADGRVLQLGAMWSDGTDFYAVGRPADQYAVTGSMFLCQADASGVFSIVGELEQDPSDPNSLAPGAVGAFNPYWFISSSSFSASSRLFKHGARWWLLSAVSAYYTDDSSGLSGWLRADLGLGTSPLLAPPLIVDATTLVIGRFQATLGDSVSVSTDGGDTWAASDPIPSADWLRHVVLLGSDVLIYSSPAGGGTYTVTSSSDLLSWTQTPVTGLPESVFFHQMGVVGGNVYGISADGVAVYSADGIDFDIATVP
jgi:hypothetical protein